MENKNFVNETSMEGIQPVTSQKQWFGFGKKIDVCIFWHLFSNKLRIQGLWPKILILKDLLQVDNNRLEFGWEKHIKNLWKESSFDFKGSQTNLEFSAIQAIVFPFKRTKHKNLYLNGRSRFEICRLKLWRRKTQTVVLQRCKCSFKDDSCERAISGTSASCL